MRSLFLLILLAACSGQGAVTCHLRSVADLPVTLVHNRIIVNGRIGGTLVPLLIDTGSERTIVTSATASSLLLARSKKSATRLVGVGGTVSNADAYAELELGGIDIQRRLAVADIPGVGGLVGGDVLSNYDLELDLPDHRVRLWRADGCGANDLPWRGPRATIPVRVTNSDRLLLPVGIDGRTARALLDSGSSISLLRTEAARQLGVTQADLNADRAGTGRGIGRGTIRVQLHTFPLIIVGQDRFVRQSIGVGDTLLGGVDMVLGVDYLRNRRVWIAYRTGEIFVQTVPAASKPEPGPLPRLRQPH